MTTESLTEREQEIIRTLTERFGGMSLDARLVDVHKQDGGEQSTLRFTLDERASSDLDRARIADASQSVEDLAEEAFLDLRGQL